MADYWTQSGAGQYQSEWGKSAAAYLRRRDICPRCDAPLRENGWCSNCRADLTGDNVATIKAQSEAAASAIEARQLAIQALVTLPIPTAAQASPAGNLPTPTSIPEPVAPQPARSEGSTISVQSVLAVVGAALLAVAAIVFTFLNPDLTNFATRTTIIGVTSGIFLLGAWLLSRAKLQFSAEAIGALGMVFVALDIWAFSHNAPPNISPYVFAGIGTAVSSIVLVAIAAAVRIRTWLWLGLLGLTTVPAWFGYAVDGKWSAIIGHLAVAFVALYVHEITRVLEKRMRSTLRADNWMATIVQLVAAFVVLVQLLTIDQNGVGYPASAVLAAIALLAILSCRNELRRFWSFLAGLFVGLSAIVLANQLKLPNDNWHSGVMPLAAAIVLAALVALSRIRASNEHPRVSRTLLIIGGLSLLLGASLLEVGFGAAQLLLPFLHPLSASQGLPTALGLAATALGCLTLWAFAPRSIPSRLRTASLILSEGFGSFAVITFAGWTGLTPTVRVAVGLACAVALSLALALVPRLAKAPMSLRIALLIAVHLMVIQAAGQAWSSPLLAQIGGGAVVLAWIAVTVAVPVVGRPIHTGIGFAYGLIVFAHVLQLAHLDNVAILSVTAAAASAVALGVTLVRAVPARYWYAVLIVAAVPFVIGVGDVLLVRSGWTALSTGVTFALALTLVLSSRPGLSRYLRAIAAALLIPALAVVIIDLGAQLLTVSASPFTLPTIAVVVACVLPSTELIGAALVRRGHSPEDARLSRIWIEVSTLVTAALAVLLALVRAAAGLDTSMIVLIIIGIGAAATAIVTKRRYGWIVAAISWTGALWSFWGTLHLQVLEPYLLPPALAAAIIGAISVARKLPGVGLYAVGLVCAAVPTLAVLAAAGNGAETPWRTIGLLGGAVILLVLGAILVRRPMESRMRVLALPTLLVASLAASGGTIQAVRVAFGPDLLWLHPHDQVMVTVLELSVVAMLIAAVAGRLVLTPERVASGRWRWVYMPAVLWLAIGPITAVRPSWLSVWTLLGLTVVLLAMMVATVVIARTRPVALPPVWFTFGVAWCVAVAGWSTRYLRVEAFSLPLGISLIAVAILVMIATSTTASGRGLNSWPVGFAGSWRVLSPGIIVTFLPSILATGTDPQTARAILVIALALVAILIGSLRKLGAPFILGIIVLPLENVTVFAAQIGHTISATSWWITLATAGLVLIVIAVTYERRSSGERGVGARLRDLK
ncbi:MAG TPA: hypothetical protein VHZ81_01085 [Galbitalea sp.]|jgi:hypothetical protein|nr:hypothetical protein [Galbitalea sp.]